MKRFLCLAALVSGLTALVAMALQRDEPATAGLAPFMGPTETAVFSGGCFWGLQAAFDKLPGVVRTRAGYTGGTTSHPTYEQVVAGGTGHAEAVEVVFDPGRLAFSELVRYFFQHHRATSDEPEITYRTRAYRSAVFVSSVTQREAARQILADFIESKPSGKPVATLVEDATVFWEAEAYHQKYLAQCVY